MYQKLTILGITILLLLTSISLAFAQGEAPRTPQRAPIIPEGAGTLQIPSIKEGSTIPQEQYLGGVFLPTITNIVIAAAGSGALLFMIIGAIEILTAYGNDDKIANGKKTITYALVGLVIAMLSYAIVTIISSIQL